MLEEKLTKMRQNLFSVSVTLECYSFYGKNIETKKNLNSWDAVVKSTPTPSRCGSATLRQFKSIHKEGP